MKLFYELLCLLWFKKEISPFMFRKTLQRYHFSALKIKKNTYLCAIFL